MRDAARFAACSKASLGLAYRHAAGHGLASDWPGRLLDDVRHLVRDQVLAGSGARVVGARAEEHVRAAGKSERIDAFREAVRGMVSVYADAGQVHANRLLQTGADTGVQWFAAPARAFDLHADLFFFVVISTAGCARRSQQPLHRAVAVGALQDGRQRRAPGRLPAVHPRRRLGRRRARNVALWRGELVRVRRGHTDEQPRQSTHAAVDLDSRRPDMARSF